MAHHIIEDHTDDIEDQFNVYIISTYGRGSVLAGQTSKRWLEAFPTLADAFKAFPKAELQDGRFDAGNTFTHLPDGPDLLY